MGSDWNENELEPGAELCHIEAQGCDCEGRCTGRPVKLRHRHLTTCCILLLHSGGAAA